MKAVVFDCFGVLYVNPGQYFYKKYVPNYEALLPQLNELGEQTDWGLITQAEMVARMSELTGLDENFVGTHVHRIHERNQELLDYVAQLRQTYKLGLLSNIGQGEMDSFFSPAERSELFDAVVLSGEEGIAKPHPYIYQLMAERLGVAAGECVMIDDIEANCAGADAAGMKTVHYVSNKQTRSELQKILAA